MMYNIKRTFQFSVTDNKLISYESISLCFFCCFALFQHIAYCHPTGLAYCFLLLLLDCFFIVFVSLSTEQATQIIYWTNGCGVVFMIRVWYFAVSIYTNAHNNHQIISVFSFNSISQDCFSVSLSLFLFSSIF